MSELLILPDCMMPDGADPCDGYNQLRERAERAEAERDALRALLADIQLWLADPKMTTWKYLEGPGMYKDLLVYLGRIAAALREDK